MTDPTPSDRRVLLLAHTGRSEARRVAVALAEALAGHGLTVRLRTEEARDLGVEAAATDGSVELTDSVTDAGAGCELAVVIGGDGSILRAAEMTFDSGTPLMGVNLGHVGFLAEAEPEELQAVIAAVVGRQYTVDHRLTLDVEVTLGEQVLARTFAVNEASVEKAARERMLEVDVAVDGRPLSRWGCDGVVCATPTGSTAYNFSAGGPVVWPDVEALCLVPLSAHALFARPMVVGPTSRIAVELVARSDAVGGVLWCDGRRTVDLPPGARVTVRRGARPIRLARMHEAPFTDRLVAKFGLPVAGWRGDGPPRHRGHQAGRPDERAAAAEVGP